ncbi:MAG: hypothetical protein AAFQ79_08085 [Pseudomonadota bacterium]
MRDLLSQLRSFETRQGYLDRLEQFFVNRDVDGIAGLSAMDASAGIAANTERFQRKALQRFADHDLDGDGVATLAEVEQVSHGRYGFTVGDPDADGHSGVARSIENVMRADIDGDTSVTQDEMLAAEQEDIDRMVAFETLVHGGLTTGLDRDGDGIVVFDEVVAGFDALLPSLDSNGDGRITSKEQSQFAER